MPRKAAAKKRKRSADSESEEDNEVIAPTSKPSTAGSRTSRRVQARNETKEEEEKTVGSWKQDGTMLYLDSTEISGSSKIASFDMDSTLIQTISGKVFAQSRSDWDWLFPEVPTKLKELHKEGVKIVIFTNQGGINGKNGWDSSKANAIKGKIADLSEALGFPLQAFVATSDDHYRKPSTFMWQYMVDNCNRGIKPDLSNCIYVGDAAGRGPGKNRPKKDFSCTDRKFAFNVGMKFATPEEYFLGESPAEFDWGALDPRKLDLSVPEDQITEGGLSKLTSNKQEMVLLVGFPGAGKSTFTKNYMIPKGYAHVNRDTLKTQEKCLKFAEEALKSGKSVVIDNTNPDVAVRSKYINLAKKYKVPARCFWIQSSEELAKHLNLFRERATKGEATHVPRIGYAVFNKNFAAPTVGEGFEEVRKVNFVPKFENAQHKQLFFQFA